MCVGLLREPERASVRGGSPTSRRLDTGVDMTALLEPTTGSIRLARLRRMPKVATALFIAALATTQAHAVQEESGDLTTTEQWREAVWRAARDGQVQRMERLFNEMPADAQEEASSRVSDLWKARNRHLAESDDDRDEGRAEALETLKTAQAEGDITAALLAAVKMQSLSDDWSAVLDEPVIQ